MRSGLIMVRSSIKSPRMLSSLSWPMGLSRLTGSLEMERMFLILSTGMSSTSEISSG